MVGDEDRIDEDLLEIIDEITDPCLKKLLTNLRNANRLTNAIGAILQDVFGKNDRLTLTFKQDNNLDSANGISYWDKNIPNKFTIALNALSLSRYSEERQTLTIMHEILHEYFREQYHFENNTLINFPNDHSSMLESYINNMAKSLEDIYPSLKDNPGVSLALCFDNLRSSVGDGSQLTDLQIWGLGQISPNHYLNALSKFGFNQNSQRELANKAKFNDASISPLGTQTNCKY
jgi:hypothetical protein